MSLSRLRIFHRAALVVKLQRELISQKNAEIVVLQRCLLECQRACLDLAIGFRVAVEKPEIDLRDELDAMIRDLSNQIAQIEEHVV